jgi:glycosyltransferase involved in cell wall biosynthesis
VNIVHLSQYFQPKLGYNDLYIPIKQQEMGHKVSVITSDRYVTSASFFGSVKNRIVGRGFYFEEGIQTYRLPCIFEFGGLTLLLTSLGSTLKAIKPDIVHCHDIFSLSLVRAALCKQSLKFGLVVDSVTGTFEPNSQLRMAFSLYRNSVFRFVEPKVDRFIAISLGSKEWLQCELGVDSEKIYVVPLGADTSLFYFDAKKRREIRRSMGLTDTDVAAIYAGKILPPKDLPVLISAVACLPSELKRNVRIIIVGDGPKECVEELKRVAERKGVLNNVILRPLASRKELYGLFSAADIGIWPGGPTNTIIEGMSSSLPIIISKYKTFRRDAYDTSHLLENSNGFGFLRGDAVELSKCLQKLVIDNELRKEMGANGRRLVEDKLNWGSIALQTLAVYSSIQASNTS